MTHQPQTEYLKTQVMTASPEMLQLMLWDGAIRFAEQGKEAIGKKDIEGSFKTLVKSQKIIMELTAGLRRDANPELCKQLAALYNFIYRRLVDANLTKDARMVDDALRIMRHQRETWAMLMEKLSEQRAAEAQATARSAMPRPLDTAPQVSQVAAGVPPQTAGAAAGPMRDWR